MHHRHMGSLACLDSAMRLWMSEKFGMLYIGLAEETRTFDEVMEGTDKRQVCFRMPGTYIVSVQFFGREPVSATLNGEPVIMPRPQWEISAYDVGTVSRFALRVTVRRDDMLVFSRAPIERVVVRDNGATRGIRASSFTAA